jgi:hypothetical protein
MLRNECVLWMTPASSKGWRGKILYLSLKTSQWELANKNWNIRFSNRIIQNLKYSRYNPNWMLQFGKPEHPIFSGSLRCGVCVAIVFHSSHLGF